MRKLKYHEQKLLKKVDLKDWISTNTKNEQLVTTKYLLHNRKEYALYNRYVGMIHKLTDQLAQLDKNDKTRLFVCKKMLDFLYEIGLIDEKLLSECKNITVSSFCKRRLPVIIKNRKLVPNTIDADKFVRHGHFQVGIRECRQPSMLIPRNIEDFIRWKENSKLKKKIDEFNEEYDDYEY